MLVDSTIDPSSPMREFGLAPLEENLEQIQIIQKAASNKDTWLVPIFNGSDSETDISIHYIHDLNECLTLWIGDAEDLMFQIQERMRLWPNLDYPLFEMNIVNEEKKVARHKLKQSFVLCLKRQTRISGGKTNYFWYC